MSEIAYHVEYNSLHTIVELWHKGDHHHGGKRWGIVNRTCEFHSAGFEVVVGVAEVGSCLTVAFDLEALLCAWHVLDVGTVSSPSGSGSRL
jgi:hypothetical protein